MSANIRLIYDNAADRATLAASPALVTTLPVGNLQDPSRGKPARTTSTADQVITGDFPGIELIGGMAITRHNLSSSAQLRLELFASTGLGGALLFDSALFNAIPAFGWGEFGWGAAGWGGSVFDDWPDRFSTLYFVAVLARSFRLTIKDAANPAGYMQIGRLFLGPYFEPSENMSYGLNCAPVEDSKQTRTDGGTLRTDPSGSYRRWSFSLDALPAEERVVITEIMRKQGKRKDMFLNCFPGVGGVKERDYAGAVKLTKLPDVPHDYYNNWRAALEFEEA